MDRSGEFTIKRERVRHFLTKNGLDGVSLSRTDSFAWLGCGADSVINAASETGVATLLATHKGVILVANNIETDRLLSEELAGLEIRDVVTFPWHDPAERLRRIKALTAGGHYAADDLSSGLPLCPPGFSSLRFQLTDAEVERYVGIGLDASTAIEAAARAVERGMSESDIAGLLASEHRSRGLLPVVVLVAADERVRRWRHPPAKIRPVQQYAMLVTCARRQGLVTAMTRFVHFGPVPAELARRHRAVCQVDAALIAASRPGRKAREVFAAGRAEYEKVGFPDEWQLHHQGGAIGYQPREYIATPECEETVLADQAFAWNPSICGTKSEDTVLISEEGFELLTAPSDDWPVLNIEVGERSIPRADMLTL